MSPEKSTAVFRIFQEVLTDIARHARDGLVEVYTKKERPRAPVPALTSHPEEQYAVRVLKAGAAGYTSEEAAPEHLVEGIRKVIKGGRYVSPCPR